MAFSLGSSLGSCVTRALGSGVLLQALMFGVAAPTALALVPAAHAQVFAGVGLVELLPPGALHADGTVSELQVLALGADGKALTGLKLRGSAASGTVGEVTEVGAGLYKFSYTPGKTDTVTQVNITLKGKVGTNNSWSGTWGVTVVPPYGSVLTAAVNPSTVTLGQDRTASLSINLAGGDRQDLTAADLKITASSGTVENITHLGGGQFTALYTAPSVIFPHLAILTIADKRNPTQTLGTVTIPLVGKTDYPVTAVAGSKVMLKIGDRQFGPILVDSTGRAKVPVIVPPGVPVATLVQITPDGQTTESPLDLRIPEGKRIGLYPVPATIPADGRYAIPVRVQVMTAEGRPDAAAQVVFSATAGVVTAAKHEGNGVYVATYTPPYSGTALQATLSVNLPDRAAVHADSVTLNLAPERATRVVLATEPASLPANTQAFKLMAKVAGPDGSGLANRTVRVTASGAEVKGEVSSKGNGDYTATLSTTGNGPVKVSVTTGIAASANPLARVLVSPAEERLTPDGASSTSVHILTVDAYGLPVARVPVALKISKGDGVIPTTVTTDDQGYARVAFTAGAQTGLVQIDAAAGPTIIGSAAILQAPASVSIPDLPVTGPKLTVDHAAEWAAAMPMLAVPRETPVTAVGGGAVVAMPTTIMAGPPAKATLVADPSAVVPGGTVTLKIRMADNNGVGVGGQRLEFLTSAGSISGLTDLGGGNYSAVLSVPQGTSGEVKVSVASADGTVSSFTKVPVSGAADTAWGAAAWGAPTAVGGGTPTSSSTTPAAASTTPSTTPSSSVTPAATPAAPAATAKVKTPREKKPASDADNRWLRILGGYQGSYYAYEQTPLAQDAATLYPKTISLPGGPVHGGGLEAEMWLPMFPYVGAEASATMVYSQIRAEDLCAGLGKTCDGAPAIVDLVRYLDFSVNGRYILQTASFDPYIAAKVGFASGDFQLYQVINNALEPSSQGQGALSVGGELGGELPSNGLYADLYGQWDLAAGTTLNRSAYGLDFGIEPIKDVPFVVGLNIEYASRHMDLTVAERTVGEVSDGGVGYRVQAGIQF